MAQTPTNALPVALEKFDSLPDSAFVRQPVVQGLLGCSAATVWRMVARGQLHPHRLSNRITGWNVGELRRVIECAKVA